jgi:hypothetical protein
LAITAASIESGAGNGWVLAITFAGTLGSFASYVLDPDGAPKVTLASSHAGFVKSGGTAVSGSHARSLIGTKPVRLPVNPASPTTPVIDETDLGGGSIRVRIALSNWVYATDTGLTLTVAAGWRAGEAAQSGIAVTNNSTLVAPIPIMRWVLPSYDVAVGSFRVSLIVGSHHPVGFEPVAGVKFTATDGANTKTVWTTTLGTDNTYGDNLRCYTAIIDPATATALTAGLLRCDAEVYPWLGSMRSTDTAGTRDCSALASAGLASAAAAPFIVGYDPAGTRYSNAFVYVDPAGTVTPSAAMVATTLAGAKAVAQASRAANVSVAVQAGYLANRTLAAANGGASATRSVDGLQVVLAPGTYSSGIGSVNATTGIQTAEIPVLVLGDPADANPRANCILQTSAATIANLRAARLRFRACAIQGGTYSLISSITTYIWLDNVEVTGRSGQETNTVKPFSAAAPPAGNSSLWLTKTKVSRTGWTIGSANLKPGLMRACEHSRLGAGHTLIKNRFIGQVEDTTVVGEQYTHQMVNDAADIGALEDFVLAYNDGRYANGGFLQTRTVSAAVAGTTLNSHRRHLILGNLVERIGATTSNLGNYGEDENVIMSYIIHENNSFVGDRFNAYYSDPIPTTNDANATTGVDGQYNIAFGIRFANNFHDWQPSKQDDYSDAQTQTVRGTSNGYRPQMIFAWGPRHGVGYEGNFEAGRNISYIGLHDYAGLRSRNVAYGDAPISPQFVNDLSYNGSSPGGATSPGGGDYTPGPSSPLKGRVLRGNTDQDLFGAARIVGGASGAVEAPANNLTATTAITFSSAGALTSTDAITATTALTFSGTGTLAGAGAITATAAINLGLTGTIAGGSAISAACAVSMAAGGLLVGYGAITASAALVLAAGGIVAGFGGLTGNIALAFDAGGSLTVANYVTAATAITFGAAGVLSSTSLLSAATAYISALAQSYTLTAEPI